MFKSLVLAPMVLVFAVPAFAATHVTKTLSKHIKEHTNVCGPNSEFTKKSGEECAIKKVRFESQYYSIKDAEDPAPMYGTLGYFGFETNSWQDITKYGFVQHLRGCTYETQKNEDGTISKRIAESIMHLGKKRIYTFHDWSIDAGTFDPLYYGPLEEDSNLPGGRVALYRWTPKLGVIDSNKTANLYRMLEMPAAKRAKSSPSVFVTDSPSMAYMTDEASQTFQNVSLEFNICLYKLDDIPLEVHNEDFLPATPIVCHKWNSQIEYDFNKKAYVTSPGKPVDAFCATQEPLNPSEVFKRFKQAEKEAKDSEEAKKSN